MNLSRLGDKNLVKAPKNLFDLLRRRIAFFLACLPDLTHVKDGMEASLESLVFFNEILHSLFASMAVECTYSELN